MPCKNGERVTFKREPSHWMTDADDETEDGELPRKAIFPFLIPLVSSPDAMHPMLSNCPCWVGKTNAFTKNIKA
jgi:hypothetical protein